MPQYLSFDLVTAATLALLKRELMGDGPSAVATRAALGVAAVEDITKFGCNAGTTPDGVMTIGDAMLRVRTIPAADGSLGPTVHNMDVMFDAKIFKDDRQPVLTRLVQQPDA